MAEIKLTGWQAVVGLLILVGLFGVRVMSFNDMNDDKALMKQIDVQLMCDYMPDEAEKLQAAVETDDRDTIQSVLSAQVDVESVEASYPLFDFSPRKEVVVKVIYSLTDDSGTRDRKTKYYLFDHGSLGNIWSYRYETNVVAYYLNFI